MINGDGNGQINLGLSTTGMKDIGISLPAVSGTYSTGRGKAKGCCGANGK